MRVLYAGEDVELEKQLQSYLNHGGHRFQIAHNGLGCMNLLRESRQDILILEQSILWGGSEGVLARISEDSDLYPIPVVLLSSHRTFSNLHGLLEFVTHLAKPYRLRALMQLENFLETLLCQPEQPMRRKPLSRFVTSNAPVSSWH